MIEVLKREYWSRADAFLLPLVGLEKTEEFEMKSYLFWNEYSINDYNLILTYSSENYDELVQYCQKHVFPILDRGGYLMENYDVAGRSIFILDISEWAMDIQMFLTGKYSKFSKEAKAAVQKFHTFNKNKIPIHVYAVMYPHESMILLDNMTPIEYICQESTYGLNLDDVKKLGEIGTLYGRMEETLLTEIDEICHN